MDRNEATTAYIGAQDLRRLYNAYRATSKANIWIMRNIRHNVIHNPSMDDDTKTDAFLQLQQKEALSLETDLVFKKRIAQLEQRIEELKSLEFI